MNPPNWRRGGHVLFNDEKEFGWKPWHSVHPQTWQTMEQQCCCGAPPARLRFGVSCWCNFLALLIESVVFWRKLGADRQTDRQTARQSNCGSHVMRVVTRDVWESREHRTACYWVGLPLTCLLCVERNEVRQPGALVLNCVHVPL